LSENHVCSMACLACELCFSASTASRYTRCPRLWFTT
jgi:hypothetical protein